MTIREATAADIADLIALGLRFRATTTYADILAENPAQMQATAAQLIADPHAVIFVSEDRSGLVSGMVGLQGFTHPISGDWTVGESFLYVMPEARGHGALLIRQAEQWSRNQGATQLHVSAPSAPQRGRTYDRPPVGLLYERLGYRVIEMGYTKKLTACEVAA